MTVVKKFNIVRFITFILALILVIGGIIYAINRVVKENKYKETYEYKFTNKGYSIEEFNKLDSKLDDKQLDKLLTYDYDSSIIDLINEKYFIWGKLDEYRSYIKKNKEKDLHKAVSIINTEAYVEWIDEERETNVEDGDLMLVNRLYGLSSDYEPELSKIPVKYALEGKKISTSILNKLTDLIDSGKENGFTFIVTEAYRSYNTQKDIYNSYVDLNGRAEADKIVARPGHSEYQTGLRLDLEPYAKTFENPMESDEYKWLRANAHKYGFIFRLDSDKEYITGFKASTWKLRYVGEEAAKVMYDENICLEEYYGYYIKGEKNE